MKRGKFIFLWLAIVVLFAGFGAFGSQFSGMVGLAYWGGLGICIATCGIVGLAVILKVKAHRLAKWKAALIILSCSMMSTVIPPLLIARTGLFHGEGSGLFIVGEAVWCFWVSVGSILLWTLTLVCIPKKAGDGIRVPRWLIIGAVAVVIAIVTLWPMKVGRRITSIDLSRLYPSIDDHYEGRQGYVQIAGAYPSMGHDNDYSFPTTNGFVRFQCSLNDPDDRLQYLQKHVKEGTSRPIGGQAFFGDWRRRDIRPLELAYRRLNMDVVFSFEGWSSSKSNVIATGEYKVDLEHAAIVMDQAILHSDPCVRFENVGLGQIFKWKASEISLLVLRLESFLIR